jgi:hypothetical protein
MSARVLSTRAKIVASAALLAAAAGAAGLGTFGSFTSTTSASESVSAGNVAIALGSAGTASNRLTGAATGIVPGDNIARGVVLSNSGDQALNAITRHPRRGGGHAGQLLPRLDERPHAGRDRAQRLQVGRTLGSRSCPSGP